MPKDLISMIYSHQYPFSLFFCSPNPILGALMYVMHFSFQTCFLNQLKDIHGTQANDGKKSNLLLMKNIWGYDLGTQPDGFADISLN